MNRPVKWMAVAAIAFGMGSLISGGRALFGGAQARAAYGHVVLFVLWFNFAAGFVYIAAGSGLLLRRRWGVSLALFLAAATLIVFAGFVQHIMSGGAYENRNLAAMIVRSSFWVVVALAARGNARGDDDASIVRRIAPSK